LYALKGEVVRRGVSALTGLEMPVFEKRRFQRGAVAPRHFEDMFPAEAAVYRRTFAELYE
jgi:asparagine synthase (glutamine-hydrolysing)